MIKWNSSVTLPTPRVPFITMSPVVVIVPLVSAVCTKPLDVDAFKVTDIVIPYSYKMLIEPASNVSVPFTVVMRMRSRIPERETAPPPTIANAFPV